MWACIFCYWEHVLPDEISEDNVTDNKLKKPFRQISHSDDLCWWVHMLVTTGGCTQIPEIMRKFQVFRILRCNLKGLWVDVKESCLVLNQFLWFLHFIKSLHEVSIVWHHVVETCELEELSNRKNHKIRARKSVWLNPLDQHHGVNKMYYQVAHDHKRSLKGMMLFILFLILTKIFGSPFAAKSSMTHA